MRYKQSTKLTSLLKRYNWGGQLPDFAEFLTKLISHMPNEPQPIQEVMRRYYMENDSAQKDDAGKYVGSDKFFYTNLQIGRAALDTIMSLSAEELNILTESKRKGLW